MKDQKQNSCSVYVTFIREGKFNTVVLCGLTAASEYIKDVILKNNWKFISMCRGIDY